MTTVPDPPFTASDEPAIEASTVGDGWNAERQRLALAAARMGDWTWDAATDLVALSHRAAEIFDVPPGRHITWTALRELLHKEDRERARLAVERAVETHTDYALDYRIVNGGRERWVSAAGRGRYDHAGGMVEMYGVLQDISSHRLLMLVDDAVRPLIEPEAITFTAARVLGQHLGVNRCAYAFVESDEDTFILTGNYNNGVDSIVGRYRFRQFGAECLRLMRAGEPYVVEDSEMDARIDAQDVLAYRLTSIRGVVCVPIMKTGRFVAAMAVHTNAYRRWSPSEVELVQQVASRCWESIERARVEAERARLLRAAEEANRAKDEFLAMLGHELRNPLAPIVTALKIMSLRGDEASYRERTIIERQVTHLTRLVDDLLDVARIARGKVELKRELIELTEVVSKAIEVAGPLLQQRGHELSVAVAPSGLAVNADAARLTQVVGNLLTNAAKYTPPGGQVSVSAHADAQNVSLVVSDTGIGMTQDALLHCFDMFVQGRQTLDRAQGGLGLGLSIVKNLIESHDGRVMAHSDGPNQGSRFTLRLPRAQADGRAEPTPTLDAAEQHVVTGVRVLVVDDNRDAAEMLSTILSMRGCQVSVAHDGPEALRLAEGSVFELGLLDIGLPGMDGYELAARLHGLPNNQNARLVALTGYGQTSDRERTRAAGFYAHLVKPVALEQVNAIIAELASN